MLSTGRLLRVMIELIFMAAGAMLLWVAWTRQFVFDARRPSWLVLSGVLILWGLRRWQRGRAAATSPLRTLDVAGGLSLAVTGLLMLSLAWAPFGWVNYLVGAAGAIFLLRGAVTVALLSVSR